MKVQVLISTMFQKDYNLLDKMNIQSDAIVINQGDITSKKLLSKKSISILWINSEDRGLSKSRNVAINNAEAEICILADDDLIYVDNYKELIRNEFEKNNEDILVFKVEGIEKNFKKYSEKAKKINYINSLQVSSVQIAFRLDKIKKHNILFNELFGSGSKFSMGEENIFLYNCLKNGLKIRYVPVKIADLHIGDSSWFKGFNKKYFIDRGAVFYQMSPLWCNLLILQFALRKNKLFKEELSFIQTITFMLQGKNECKLLMKGKVG